METNLMGNKGRVQDPEDPEDNIFANNPFLEDLLEWRASPTPSVI